MGFFFFSFLVVVGLFSWLVVVVYFYMLPWVLFLWLWVDFRGWLWADFADCSGCEVGCG